MRLLLAISAALAIFSLPPVAAPEESHEAAATPPAATTQTDLDRAARDYRIAVYNTFRSDRAEFDRRNAAWREIYARWKNNGEKPGDIPALVDWLEHATSASRTGHIAALPRTPLFGLAKSPSPQPFQDAAVAPAVKPPAQPTIEPAIPPLARRTPAATPPHRGADVAALPAVPLPISPTLADPHRTARPTPSDATESAALASEPPRRAAPPASISPEAIDPPHIVSPHLDPPHVISPEIAPEIVERAVPDGIDVGEVAIRVAGHNLALATLAEDIRKAQSQSIEQLAGFVERLESHAIRVQDLTPYYALVGENERPRLQPLAAIDSVLELLRQRITALNVAITTDAALPETTRNELLARVAELERRLEKLSSTTS